MARSTTQDELNTLFAQAGTVSSVEVIKDRDSGESKGFAFITMAGQSEAEKAISMFNAYSLGNRDLKVNVAPYKLLIVEDEDTLRQSLLHGREERKGIIHAYCPLQLRCRCYR